MDWVYKVLQVQASISFAGVFAWSPRTYKQQQKSIEDLLLNKPLCGSIIIS